MIQAQHNRNQQNANSFSPKEDLGEIIADLYKKVNGFRFENLVENDIGETASNFSLDDTLETIDRARSPLAEKRLEGQMLTTMEFVHLDLLDSLTDKIQSLMMQEPGESIDVKLALEQAKRVARKK